jgi:hypothetical protein
VNSSSLKDLLCGSHPLPVLAIQIRWPKHSMAFLTYQSSCYLQLQSTHELDIESVHTYILNTDGLECEGWGADPWYHSPTCPGPHNHPPLSAPFSLWPYNNLQYVTIHFHTVSFALFVTGRQGHYSKIDITSELMAVLMMTSYSSTFGQSRLGERNALVGI